MKSHFKIFLYFSLFVFSFSLISCSPQKRLARLLKKHPELLIADTIKIKDTILVPGIKIDTFFHKSALKDTIKFSKEKLKLKLFEFNDTIYVNADVKPDTVYFERKIVVEKIIGGYDERQKWIKSIEQNITSFFGFAFILFLFLRFFKCPN